MVNPNMRFLTSIDQFNLLLLNYFSLVSTSHNQSDLLPSLSWKLGWYKKASSLRLQRVLITANHMGTPKHVVVFHNTTVLMAKFFSINLPLLLSIVSFMRVNNLRVLLC